MYRVERLAVASEAAAYMRWVNLVLSYCSREGKTMLFPIETAMLFLPINYHQVIHRLEAILLFIKQFPFLATEMRH
ncbi:hypothetical protein [Yersinia phage PY54]|uniref:hypothetical protein n=1 Tax=Yersinia phage PY54 TaxID=172667 RepID=UPI00001B983C|nr:hypothetical protein PY54p15A [Yersinia phage PY54]CAD91776.1 hypothetical protein [Yersinia phage PY54]